MIVGPTTRARFETHVADADSRGCRIWLGARTSRGYGSFWLQPKYERAHRVAWALYRAPIPAGLQVLHTCDVPLCVNPNHLFLGTDADNNADMRAKGRGVYLRGEDHGRAEVTEADVMEIRRRHAAGATFTALGEAYGISRVAIRNIVRRRSWSHVH